MGTGAIAIGTAATSTSTTTITLIRTTISIATSTGDKADKVTGSTTHNTGETHLTVTEEPRTSSVVRVPAEPVIAAVQVIGREALAELDVPVAQVELEALAGLEDQVVPAVRAALVVPENPVAPVALAVQVAPVALELVPVVVQALVIVPVAVALVIVLAAAVPELDQVAVPLKIRSATEAHHRDLARLLAAVEDLAAGVETTRDPAATEAGIAWAAAG